MSTRPASMEPVIFTPQTVYCGDCLEILKHFPSEAVDLIYIDPPFNSNRNYEVFWGDHQEKRAFNDRYGDAMAYINYMRPRIAELYRVLKPTGSFYYHCDWHASHYIKGLDSNDKTRFLDLSISLAREKLQNSLNEKSHQAVKISILIAAVSLLFALTGALFTSESADNISVL